MRTQEIELFCITELDEEAKTKAVEYLRDSDYYGADTGEIEGPVKDKLREYGLPTETIEWSLGHSQGDGVAFYGDIDVQKLLMNIGEWSKYSWLVYDYELSATSTRNSLGNHYSHFNTMDVYMQRERDYRTEQARMLGKELWELIKLRVQSVSKELEKLGYEIIEASREKEYIIECAEANEMEFREDGRLWHG